MARLEHDAPSSASQSLPESGFAGSFNMRYRTALRAACSLLARPLSDAPLGVAIAHRNGFSDPSFMSRMPADAPVS